MMPIVTGVSVVRTDGELIITELIIYTVYDRPVFQPRGNVVTVSRDTEKKNNDNNNRY